MALTFRRVHGRIIPIRVEGSAKDKKNAAKGAGLVAAGAGVSAGAGAVYRKMVHTSVKYSARGFRGMTKAFDLADAPLRHQTLFARAARVKGTRKMTAVAEAMLAKGAKIGKFAPGVRIGGIAAGSALIGAGIAKIYKSGRKKPKKGESEAVGTTVATGAFLAGAYRGAGARQALKGVYKKAYPLIRALKGKWKL